MGGGHWVRISTSGWMLVFDYFDCVECSFWIFCVVVRIGNGREIGLQYQYM